MGIRMWEIENSFIFFYNILTSKFDVTTFLTNTQMSSIPYNKFHRIGNYFLTFLYFSVYFGMNITALITVVL